MHNLALLRLLKGVITLFSSPEPLGSQGELIAYPSSRRPSASDGQRFSPKPLGGSKQNFMWSLLG